MRKGFGSRFWDLGSQGVISEVWFRALGRVFRAFLDSVPENVPFVSTPCPKHSI